MYICICVTYTVGYGVLALVWIIKTKNKGSIKF